MEVHKKTIIIIANNINNKDREEIITFISENEK